MVTKSLKSVTQVLAFSWFFKSITPEKSQILDIYSVVTLKCMIKLFYGGLEVGWSHYEIFPKAS